MALGAREAALGQREREAKAVKTKDMVTIKEKATEFTVVVLW